MPYSGVNVRKDDYVLLGKVHGPNVIDINSELIEFFTHQAPDLLQDVDITLLVKRFAAAVREHPDALWVSIDIVGSGGRMIGDICEIEENY